MFEKFLIFILFLCPLIFFHELGHFLFARLFKVRVEVFSLGFGPKLFKFKKGFTEYAVSLIPLGGYIKMFGDDPMLKDEIPEEDRKYSFSFQKKWARFWIVFGGPLANIIFAYVLFFLLLLVGEKAPEVKFGMIHSNTSFYEKGIRTGDIIKKINGDEVFNPTDLALSTGEITKTITVQRGKTTKEIALGMNQKQFIEFFMGRPPFLRKPIVVDSEGVKYGVSLDSIGVDWSMSFDQMADKTGEVNFYLFKFLSNSDDEQLTVPSHSKVLTLNINKQSDFFEGFLKLGFLSSDLLVKSIEMKSPADIAGIKGNDVITGINGKRLMSFEELPVNLQQSKDVIVKIDLWRKGKEISLDVTPRLIYRGDVQVKQIGVYSGVEYIGLNFVQSKSKGFFNSLYLAVGRTSNSIIKTLEGFRRLITNEVSIKSIGGPIAIGKVAVDSYNLSLSYFFQIMALISINLFIINLLPIPVLDGGHILFIFLEVINRGPLSRRKMEIAQQVGLSLLLLLTFAALYNDFSRLL